MIQFKCLPYRPLRITSPYGDRSAQVKNIPGATWWHDGVDIGRDLHKYANASIDGGDVLAVLDGKVVAATSNNARGKYIILQHESVNGKKVETLYQHLYLINVKLDTVVKAGQVIGRMGKTGVGAGLHLHFELRINGKPIDPTASLKNAPVTKPHTQSNEVKKDAIQNRFNFDDRTMKELQAFPDYPSLLVAWTSMKVPRKIQDSTKTWILKNVSFGEEVLRRVYTNPNK